MRKDTFVLRENLTVSVRISSDVSTGGGWETDLLRWWLNCFRWINDRFYYHAWHLIASTSRYHHRASNTRRVYVPFELLSLVTNEIFAYTETIVRGSCIFLYDGRSFILRCNYVPVVFNASLGIFLSECSRFRIERDLSRHAWRENRPSTCACIGRACHIKGQDAVKIPDSRRFTISSIITLIQSSV